MTVSQRSFSGAIDIPRRVTGIDYRLRLSQERFTVFEPQDYDPSRSYGLLVYVSPGDGTALPQSWLGVLHQKNLLLVAPHRAGNNQPAARRMGLAVLGALVMQRDYTIDPERVYVAGLSGGARVANVVAFLHPELFKGALLLCGASYYRDVSHQRGSADAGYVVLVDRDRVDLEKVRRQVRFALVTGSADWRQKDVQDIYFGGYRPDRFQAGLIDVPGLGHTHCGPATLAAALDFLAQKQ